MVNLVEMTKGGRRFAALLFALGLLQVAGYWFSGAMVNGSDALAIPQPDTLLYLQAARRVAEGHPFSFTEGSAQCTGTTSILHQFVLAPFYLLGAKGDSFVAAGFMLNVLFYMIFLGGWGYVIWQRLENPSTKWLAGAGLALFGQIAYSAFAQSDIGLWLAISTLLVVGLVSELRGLFAVMLIVGPWVRPEGMVFVIAFMASLFIHAVWNIIFPVSNKAGNGSDGFGTRSDWILAFLAFISMVCVFVFNWFLTGHAQFASVANKGYFTQHSFANALYFGACDFINIVRSLMFGISLSPPRQFYFIPVIGSALLWTGVFVHPWQRKMLWNNVVYLLAIMGGLWTVATSGWQNTNVDRYIAWIMPPLVIFSAEGAMFLFQKLRMKPVAVFVPVSLIVFFAGAAVSFWALFHSASAESDLLMKFGKELNRQLPKDSAVGLTGYTGLAYPLGGHRIASLNGIYSPELAAKTSMGNLEVLKNEPSTRFDYWLFAGDDKFPNGFCELQEPELMNGPGGISVRRANWSAFDYAAAAPKVNGMKMVWRVDVGYEPDEKQSGYEVETRYGLMAPEPVARVDTLLGKNAFECGRVVYGSDSMFAVLKPGKDCKIVMRTAREESTHIPSWIGPRVLRKFEFSSPIKLNVAVNGEVIKMVSAEVAEKGFSDVVFDIPGSVIRTSPCRISFLGDHIAFAYWFFQ